VNKKEFRKFVAEHTAKADVSLLKATDWYKKLLEFFDSHNDAGNAFRDMVNYLQERVAIPSKNVSTTFDMLEHVRDCLAMAGFAYLQLRYLESEQERVEEKDGDDA
jgi:hypothetical protein